MRVVMKAAARAEGAIFNMSRGGERKSRDTRGAKLLMVMVSRGNENIY